jgi:hypothetical protein
MEQYYSEKKGKKTNKIEQTKQSEPTTKFHKGNNKASKHNNHFPMVLVEPSHSHTLPKIIPVRNLKKRIGRLIC